MKDEARRDVELGLACGVAAYFMWGLLPIYLRAVDAANPLEVLGQRIIWSVPFGAAVLTLRKQWRDVAAAFADAKAMKWLTAAACIIALNWLIYIWAVGNERILEASLGYYINPLMFVAIGVVVLKEKLNRLQWAAFGLAAVGVTVLTFGAGVFPWVSFVLAISFTLYGYIKKQVAVGAMPSLFIETAVLSPIAVLALAWLAAGPGLSFGAGGAGLTVLLVLAGPVTVLPLTFFAIAARRLRLSTIGFLQYIGPSLQFALGIYYGEPFSLAHGICFGLIWSGLALISVDAVQKNRRASR